MRKNVVRDLFKFGLLLLIFSASFYFVISTVSLNKRLASTTNSSTHNSVQVGQGGGPPSDLPSPSDVPDVSGAPVVLEGPIFRVVSNKFFWIGNSDHQILVLVENPDQMTKIYLGEGISSVGTLKPLPSAAEIQNNWHLGSEDMRLLHSSKYYFDATGVQVSGSGQVI